MVALNVPEFANVHHVFPLVQQLHEELAVPLGTFLDNGKHALQFSGRENGAQAMPQWSPFFGFEEEQIRRKWVHFCADVQTSVAEGGEVFDEDVLYSAKVSTVSIHRRRKYTFSVSLTNPGPL